jgi:RNA polymerase sigma-70 factor, ECF subfamily
MSPLIPLVSAGRDRLCQLCICLALVLGVVTGRRGVVASPDVTSGQKRTDGQPGPALSPPPAPILRRVAEGDEGAIAECLDRYGGLVWSLARRLSPSEGDAEDATQEIFVDLWKSAGRYDAAIVSEASFVAMIARRRLIDRRRSRQRRPEEAPLEQAEAVFPENNTEAYADARVALRALDALSPEQRDILVLSAVQGLSHAEIAQHRQLPLGTVKARARRALLKVRALLFGEPEASDAEEGEAR